MHQSTCWSYCILHVHLVYVCFTRCCWVVVFFVCVCPVFSCSVLVIYMLSITVFWLPRANNMFLIFQDMKALSKYHNSWLEMISYSYGHLSVITGYKWDYTFYKWAFLPVLLTGITRAITADHPINTGAHFKSSHCKEYSHLIPRRPRWRSEICAKCVPSEGETTCHMLDMCLHDNNMCIQLYIYTLYIYIYTYKSIWIPTISTKK